VSRDQGQVADPWRVSLEYYALQVFRSADAISSVSLISINDCFHSLVIDWIFSGNYDDDDFLQIRRKEMVTQMMTMMMMMAMMKIPIMTMMMSKAKMMSRAKMCNPDAELRICSSRSLPPKPDATPVPTFFGPRRN